VAADQQSEYPAHMAYNVEEEALRVPPDVGKARCDRSGCEPKTVAEWLPSTANKGEQ